MCNRVMVRRVALCSGLLLAALLSGCGGSDSDSDDASTSVSVRFSDAPVEEAAKVVITVDRLTFNREGADDIVVDTFTSSELDIENAETFQLDLLEVQGNDNRLVMDAVELPVGDYSNLRVRVLDDDINYSFVEEVTSGLMKPIKVPSDELKLGGFTVADTGTQTFVVEFGLRQSLTYNPTPERYILKPRGVRIVDSGSAATLAGTVDINDLNSRGCADKPDPSVDNVAYLYAGHGLDPAKLGDVFVREGDEGAGDDFDPDVPADIVAPHAVADVDGSDGSYLFSYLDSGDYTLAISCAAVDDDPVIYNDLVIPAPSTELVEITLAIEEDRVCDFPLADGACGNE